MAAKEIKFGDSARHKLINGVNVLADGAVRLEPAPGPPEVIASGPRVGVSLEADRPWRFWIADDPTVSPYRAGTRRRRIPT